MANPNLLEPANLRSTVGLLRMVENVLLDAIRGRGIAQSEAQEMRDLLVQLQAVFDEILGPGNP